MAGPIKKLIFKSLRHWGRILKSLKGIPLGVKSYVVSGNPLFIEVGPTATVDTVKYVKILPRNILGHSFSFSDDGDRGRPVIDN